MLLRAQRLPNLTLTLQWVKGNVEKAEDSFFKINKAAAPINDTEMFLLKARKKPNAIAARAIIRSGTGHKYWSFFQDDNKKEEIEQLAREINQMLFKPELDSPGKSVEVPLAGKGYSADTLPLVFDVVNLCNSIEQRVVKKTAEIQFFIKKGEEEIAIEDDLDGAETIKILKKARKILYRICSEHSSSLGLHPQVYFYSTTGRYQITALLAIIEMMKDFEEKDKFKYFIDAREGFEKFLIEHKIFVNQSTVHTGSGMKGYKHLKKLFSLIIDNIYSKKTSEDIVNSLIENPEYDYLNPKQNETKFTKRKDFPTETKSAIYINKLLEKSMKCSICGGFMHPNSATIDHIIRKEDGGTGVIENGEIAHPYCNGTVKN
jgi:hypothetical protein